MALLIRDAKERLWMNKFSAWLVLSEKTSILVELPQA